MSHPIGGMTHAVHALFLHYLSSPRRTSGDESYLRRAHAPGRTGRLQVDAAIQSVHGARAQTGI